MTLLILAAGLGSRFGGMKQVAPVGPTGEFIIDYSCRDAIRAGFNRIVFVIKKENLEIFRESVGKRVEPYCEVKYVFQDPNDLPEGFSLPEGRVKPWGTAHALLAARDIIDDNFATINADDFYGPEAYKLVSDFLKASPEYDIPMKLCMAGYRLNNTLTENGSVSRGICETDEKGILLSITERTKITPDGENAVFEENGVITPLSGSSIASMNFFGLTPAIFEFCKKEFSVFLKNMKDPMKDEFYLPVMVSSAIKQGLATVNVLPTADRWFGVTYAADKPAVVNAIAGLVEKGVYTSDLWSGLKNDPACPDILELAGSFDLGSKPVKYKENKTGHINSTYFITCENGKRYVLQRINTYVFKDPVGLMNNAVAVTGHIREKVVKAGGDASRCTLRFVPVKGSGSYCLLKNGDAYRIYEMVENATSKQAVESPEEFKSVGNAFGHFQMQLSDFDASVLCETIPDFHNTESRYANFERSLKADPKGRAASIGPEIEFVRAHKETCSYIVSRIKDGTLPLRVTHNDTKLNNILLDAETSKPVCVIDLDTVMPGSVLYDFGDAIRFGAATAAEDETDLTKVGVSTELFEAFADGFISGLEGSLTSQETEALPMGAVVITLETGIRFLTDYLDGDVYFRTEHEGHNLERARNQFKMVADLEEKLPVLDAIIKKHL